VVGSCPSPPAVTASVPHRPVTSRCQPWQHGTNRHESAPFGAGRPRKLPSGGRGQRFESSRAHARRRPHRGDRDGAFVVASVVREAAQLLARVYEVHPLRCPTCHGQMRILAVLTDPGVVRPILRHLRIPEHPPASPPRTRSAADRAARGRPALAVGPRRPGHPGPRPLRPEPRRRRRHLECVSQGPEGAGDDRGSAASCAPPAQSRISVTRSLIPLPPGSIGPPNPPEPRA